MSEILRDPDGMITDPEWLLGKEAKCSVCGKPADAEWRGNQDICICLDCGLSCLPKMIADVIASQCPTYGPLSGNFHRYESDILLTYWKAAAAAISSRNRSHPRPRASHDR